MLFASLAGGRWRGIITDVLRQVGDSIDDMTAGHKAGTATVLLANECNGHLKGHEHTGMWIERLDELIKVLEEGFEEGRQGRG